MNSFLARGMQTCWLSLGFHHCYKKKPTSKVETPCYPEGPQFAACYKMCLSATSKWWTKIPSNNYNWLWQKHRHPFSSELNCSQQWGPAEWEHKLTRMSEATTQERPRRLNTWTHVAHNPPRTDTQYLLLRTACSTWRMKSGPSKRTIWKRKKRNINFLS